MNQPFISTPLIEEQLASKNFVFQPEEYSPADRMELQSLFKRTSNCLWLGTDRLESTFLLLFPENTDVYFKKTLEALKVISLFSNYISIIMDEDRVIFIASLLIVSYSSKTIDAKHCYSSYETAYNEHVFPYLKKLIAQKINVNIDSIEDLTTEHLIRLSKVLP